MDGYTYRLKALFYITVSGTYSQSLKAGQTYYHASTLFIAYQRHHIELKLNFVVHFVRIPVGKVRNEVHIQLDIGWESNPVTMIEPRCSMLL